MNVAQSLPELLESLRDRGLRRGVDPGPMVAADPLPTGQPGLDAALRSGGWPRGALALLDAPTGSGATSLALGSLAACQADGGLVAWLDPFGRLDPSTAARLGVSLEWLLVVRPADPVEALELAGWLARSRLIDLLVLDLADAPPPRGLERLTDRLADQLRRTTGAALLLADAAGREAAARASGVRVALQRLAWLAVGEDLVGQRISATVTRHRWALPGDRAELDLWFGEGRRIDPLLRSAASPREVEPAVAAAPAPPLRVISA
jgi:recombination protein RecA